MNVESQFLVFGNPTSWLRIFLECPDLNSQTFLSSLDSVQEGTRQWHPSPVDWSEMSFDDQVSSSIVSFFSLFFSLPFSLAYVSIYNLFWRRGSFPRSFFGQHAHSAPPSMSPPSFGRIMISCLRSTLSGRLYVVKDLGCRSHPFGLFDGLQRYRAPSSWVTPCASFKIDLMSCHSSHRFIPLWLSFKS